MTLVPDYPGEFTFQQVESALFIAGVILVIIGTLYVSLGAFSAIVAGGNMFNMVYDSLVGMVLVMFGGLIAVPSFASYHLRRRYQIRVERKHDG